MSPMLIYLKNCLNVIVITVVLSLLTSCRGQIDGNENWLGLWSGNKAGEIYFLDLVKDNGASSYELVGELPVYGTLRVNEKEKELKVGKLVFKIEKTPALNESNQWEMRVEGVSYVRN